MCRGQAEKSEAPVLWCFDLYRAGCGGKAETGIDPGVPKYSMLIHDTLSMTGGVDETCSSKRIYIFHDPVPFVRLPEEAGSGH